MPLKQSARTRLLEAMINAIWEHSYGSATVEEICERAEVGKGSFYHFFKSKTALSVAAIEHLWETHSQPALDEIFSPDVPPLERFERLISHWHKSVQDLYEEKGRVLGCPYFNLAAELAPGESELGAKTREILDRYQGYLEATLHEANASGDISITDPATTANCLFAMIEGCSTQARIHNDPERVRHCSEAFGRMIGTTLTPDLAPLPAVAAR